jgi:hypothetical protein
VTCVGYMSECLNDWNSHVGHVILKILAIFKQSKEWNTSYVSDVGSPGKTEYLITSKKASWPLGKFAFAKASITVPSGRVWSPGGL